MLGKIKSIKVIENLKISPVTPSEGSGGRLGMRQMLSIALAHYSSMSGYEIKTTKHKFVVLIEDQQSCCESWGYMQSDDNLDYFKKAELLEVKLTDAAFNEVMVEKSNYYDGDNGGIKFIDFITDRGVFQLAVYNSHNGYYGHSIAIGKDEDVLFADVL